MAGRLFGWALVACCFAVVISKKMSKPVVKKVAAPSILGEGPHWDVKSQSLYYVDIYGQKVLRLDPSTGAITTANFSCGSVGAVIPVKDKSDQLVVACGTDVLLVTWDGKTDATDPPHEKLASLDLNSDDTRVNDGKCDRAGRFWIGTMANEHDGVIMPNKGALYRVDNDGQAKGMIAPVSISNGLAWNSDDDVFYYIDSPTRNVFAFDYDNQTGNISNKRVVFDLSGHNIHGVPDGMTIDTNDNLWFAIHNASIVVCIDPRTGELLRRIEVPAKKVTSVAFGGENLDVLYVTSAYTGLNSAERQLQPDSGCVFAIEGLGARGVPANDFVLRQF